MRPRMRLAIRDGKAVLINKPKKPKKVNPLDHIAICLDSPKEDERWDYDQYGMTPQEITARDREIYREVRDNRNCYNCNTRFETNQKICEGCGVNLSRM